MSGELVQAVTVSCEAAGLQAVPALVTKCLQLQDTLAVRFGVMLVGPAGMFVPTKSCLQLCSVLFTMLRWQVVVRPVVHLRKLQHMPPRHLLCLHAA